MGWFSKSQNKGESNSIQKMAPFGRCEFEINGESYKTGNLKKLFSKYNVAPGEYHTLNAILVADPSNPYDKNAVEVFIDDLSVGYIPKNKAKKVSILLQNETKNGQAEVYALIKYGSDDISYSTVRLDLDWPPKILK